jgi:importin subunit beta-1
VDNERNYLMTVICEACTQGATDEVKENAFECLGRIAELYYDKLPSYMQTILEQTLNAINTQSDAVARQAINVWVMVCDAEYDAENGDDPAQCQKFIKGAAKYLIPVLLQTMAKQEEDQDVDSYNKSTEAAWCLVAIATVIENEVMEIVVPWVQQNIQQGDWRLREAAVMAYGCIMEGLNENSNMASHAPAVLDFCLGYIKDDANDLVKHSASWTITKVFESEHAFITVLQGLDARIQRILEVMHTAEPPTSAQLAQALRNVAEGVMRLAEEPEKVAGLGYPLAPVFQVVVDCLYATADRSDADENNLRHECYETIHRVLDSANPDKTCDAWRDTCTQVVAQFIIPNLLPRFGERLNAELGKPVVGSDEINARTDWVAYFCGAIQMCIMTLVDKQMLTTPDANGQTVADKFMILFLQVFQFQSTTVAAEALLAVNQILNKLEDDFVRYMDAFAPVLVGCLGAVQDVQLCRAATTTVSDLAEKLKEKVLPFSDNIVQALLGVFANPVSLCIYVCNMY